MQLETIRGWQFTRLELGIRSVEHILRGADPATLTLYRDGGNGWTAVQVLGHLRDMETVFLQRVRLTLHETNPRLPFPDPDELAASRDYNRLNPDYLLNEWKMERTTLLTVLRECREADWERPALHPVRGPFTLHDQLFLASLHDSIHLEQLTRLLAEQRTA